MVRSQYASLLSGVALFLLSATTTNAFVAPAKSTVPLLSFVGAAGNSRAAVAVAGKDKDAADDGGPVPTDAEWKKIKEMKANVHYPRELVTTVKHIARPLGRLASFLNVFKKTDPNRVIYGVLKTVRDGTKLQEPLIVPVDFSAGLHDTLYYQTKKSTLNDARIALVYPILRNAPPIKDDPTLMAEADYKKLIDNKIAALGMLKCENATQCFLKNAPAFCNTAGVCDLDYLSKYQVKRGLVRYGGVAIVRDGKIMSISGVTPDAAGYDSKLAVFLASFGVHVIVIRHATMAHLAIYQRLLIKTTTNRSKAYKDMFTDLMGPKRFLEGLMTRTNEVSINQQLLTGPGNSLVGRATSFTNDGLLLAVSDAYDKYKEMTPAVLIDEVGSCGSTAWKSSCTKAYDSAVHAVQAICNVSVDQDVLDSDSVNDLALMVWASTFYHAFIGDFQLDNVNRGNLPLLNTGREHVQTKSYGILSTTIGITTMTRTCNMETLASYFPDPAQRAAWQDYLDLLTSLDIGIPEYKAQSPIYNSINF
jgi:hypothetical protein